MYRRPHWSFSSLNQYLRCPLQFYFQRVLGLPQPTVGSGLVLGSAVHTVLEEYHRGLQEHRTLGHDHLQKSFITAWESREGESEIRFKAGDSRTDNIDQGVALIETYLEEPPPENIVAVEQSFISPVRNSRGEYLETPIVAIVDLITDNEHALKVNEFKTSGRAYSQMEADTSLQPNTYVNAVQQAYDRPAEVEYTVLVKTKTPKVQRLDAFRTEEDLGRLGDIIETVERAVQNNVFYPVESPLNCSTCPFRRPCREWGRPQLEREELAVLEGSMIGAG